MTDIIKVLDRGYVRLVEHLGSDIDVVRAARTSYNASWRTGEDEGKDEKLIKYLLDHHHEVPFEHVIFKFEVHLPIFVARQWFKHRTWSISEVSGRYVELPDVYYVPVEDRVGVQDEKNKQSRVFDHHDQTEIVQDIDQINMGSFFSYKKLLEKGCPRELARTVLPLGIYTKFIGTVDLRNLLSFIHLRDHPGAQWEIQEYARAIKILISDIVPITMKYAMRT